MKKLYKFNLAVYETLYDVRQASGILFAEEPTDDELQALGIEVVYIEPTPEEIAEAEKQVAKEQRAETIAKATVEVDGMTFNADLTALQLIACTLSIATFRGYNPDYKIKWVLACDEWTYVTLDQLARVAETAGLIIDDEWVKPYPEYQGAAK